MLPSYLSSNEQTKTTNYTMVAADSGLVTNVTGTTTITLPAAASGLVGATFTIRNAGPNNGDTLITIAPNAADGVSGLGYTAATGKGPQQLAANSPHTGDQITLVCSGVTGVAGWYVTNAVGSWTRLP
jgi:hypothetical protein